MFNQQEFIILFCNFFPVFQCHFCSFFPNHGRMCCFHLGLFVILQKIISIMRFLEYLFFKYYNLGIKLGSKQNASTSAILLLSFVFTLYLVDVAITLDCLFGINWDSRWIVGFLIVSIVILILVFDFTLVYFGKSSRIVSKHKEEWTGKKNLGAILFPIIAILWFSVYCVVKILMNRGVL